MFFVVQMDAYNLAIMFGPSLVRPHDDDMATMLKDINDQSQIVESLIRHVGHILILVLSCSFYLPLLQCYFLKLCYFCLSCCCQYYTTKF